MANIEHKNIVDPNVHEPKGISTAPNGYAYLANGSGSGVWGPVVTPSTLAVTCATGTFTATKFLDNVASGIFIAFPTFHQDYIAGNLYAPNSGGYFSVTKNGLYSISYRLTVTIDVALGGQEASISIKPVRTMADTPMHPALFPNFSANNIVYNTDGEGNSVPVGNASAQIRQSAWYHGTTPIYATQGLGFWATGTFKASSFAIATNIIRYSSVYAEVILSRLGDV